MSELLVKPLDCIGKIRLLSSRTELRNTLGSPTDSMETVDYFNNIAVNYNENNVVEFIEASRTSEIKLTIGEIDIFNTPASELIERLTDLLSEQYDPNEPELPYSYIYLNLELSFWRPTVPEHPDDEDGKYFETVGIGRKGYFSE